MSIIKAIRRISLALAVLLFLNPVVSASEALESEPQDIIDISQLTPEQLTYQTAEVERGSFINEVDVTSTKYYPLTYNVRFEQDNAKFVEFTVAKGDTVKAGDVLARFTITGSNAESTRLKLDLQRTEEQTTEGIREREQEIAGKRKELKNASDEYEKELLELSIKKLEAELEQYKYRQQYSIDQKRKAYNEEYARRTTDVLVSPVDGVVRDIAYKMVDDAVLPDETLVTIVAGESMLLEASNESGSLRYNMPVEIQVGSYPDQTYVTGRVVAADDAIPRDERTGYALIQLDNYDENISSTRTMRIIAQDIRLDNVLLIPKQAMLQGYVTKLTDGMVQKRFIETGGSNSESIWVLAGVEEGETLILE